MATQREQLLMLLILAVSSVHTTCMGFGLPPIITPPTLPPPTLPSQGPEPTDQLNSTQEPGTNQPGTDTTPEPNPNNISETFAHQVELYVDVVIPPIATRVKLGQFAVKKPSQFTIGPGLDLVQGMFKAPDQGIYYFSVSVHIKPFPPNTGELSGSLSVGVCTDNRCTVGSLQDAAFSATAPFHIEGLSVQASGLLQLEKCQLVEVLLEHSCNTNFVIASSSSLSIIKLM